MIRISTYLSIALFGLVCGACDNDMPVATEASAHTPDSATSQTDEPPASDRDPRTASDRAGTESTDEQTGRSEEDDLYPIAEKTSLAQESNSTEDKSAESSDDQLSGVVNLNRASVDRLQLLPGIGPALASRIDEYRAKRRFEQPDDIKRVRGIGDATFEKLEAHLSVDGPTTLKN